ncbi:MAG: metallophosphoesterase family protein [Actinobacteria bacterium]|nr:metallophosphoesterase family protein [Actinomycetota bacterium]
MHRRLAYVLVGLLGAGAGLLALGTVTTAQGRVGPGKVAVRAHLGAARTEFRLPPLGQISAATHFAPVTLIGQVDEISPERLQDVLKADDPGDRLRSEVAADLEPLLRAFAWRALLTAAVAGALAGALFPRRRWTHPLAGSVAAVVTVALLLGGAWRGYDAEAFDKARFEGPLERAPALLATVRKHVDDIAVVRKRVQVLGDQVADLYSVASSQVGGPVGGDEVRILHISDIHSNPLGLEVARRLAEHFKVAAVLDTGDLTSFGLPVEGRLGDMVGAMKVPYLLVPGNHDSSENRKALAGVHNIQVLDGTVAEVGGVRILGVGDPTFTATNETSTAEAAEIKRARAPDVAAEVDEFHPDVLAVHDPLLGEASQGHVPLIVAGHLHKNSAARKDGTLVLTVGSTGATGLGSFTVDTGSPYEAELLHFVGRDLVAVDRIDLHGVGGAFRVERQIVPAPGEAPELATQDGRLP